jgi:hypothetical protein
MMIGAPDFDIQPSLFLVHYSNGFLFPLTFTGGYYFYAICINEYLITL